MCDRHRSSLLSRRYTCSTTTIVLYSTAQRQFKHTRGTRVLVYGVGRCLTTTPPPPPPTPALPPVQPPHVQRFSSPTLLLLCRTHPRPYPDLCPRTQLSSPCYIAQNTQKDTKNRFSVWEEWCQHCRDTTSSTTIPPLSSFPSTNLQFWSIRFILEVRKKDGSEYNPALIHYYTFAVVLFAIYERIAILL